MPSPTNLRKSSVSSSSVTLSHPGKCASISYAHLAQACGWTVNNPSGRAQCSSSTSAQQHVCFLNIQQLVHIQLGCTHHVKFISLYFFLQGFPVVLLLSKQQQSPFPLGTGTLLASGNCLCAHWVSSASPEWRAAVRAWTPPTHHEKAHFPPRQAHSQKMLIKCFIFKNFEENCYKHRLQNGRWVRVAFLW